MKISESNPPREFETGREGSRVCIKDCAHIRLDPEEMVTFLTDSDNELDVVRKSWGFYATPSLNGRLSKFNLRGVLVKNSEGQYFIWLVEKQKEAGFMQYLKEQNHCIVTWLDSDQALEHLEGKLAL